VAQATAATWAGRLSLAHLTIDRAEPLDFVEAAAAGGFDAQVAGNPALLRDLQRRLAETGLKVLQVNSFWIGPDTGMEHILPVLDAAEALGAEHVLVVLNDPDRARGTAMLARCCEAAAARGLVIALEFQSYGMVRSLRECLGLVEASGLSNIGIVLDTLHFARSGGQPSDLARIDRERVRFIHLSDAPAQSPPVEALRIESRGKRLLPGEGELPLVDILTALPGVPIDVEAPSERFVHLTPAEQARVTADATRRFLALHRISGFSQM
jgi:sugar phosphate isomerase/epimerase